MFDESRRKELKNKAYPSEFMAATMFFGSRSVDWMFCSLEVATTFLLFRILVPFPFTVFPEAFLVVFPRLQWAIFVAGARGGVRSWCFIGRRPELVDSSFDEVVISSQNFRIESETRALFLRVFPCFKRINRVYRFDGLLRNLAKMFLGYQCEKGCEAFLLLQILLLFSAPM